MPMENPTSSRGGNTFGLPETITCVDCGGTAHLLTTFPPDDPPVPGDPIAYRCAECGDRWDLVVDDADVDPEPPGW